MGASEHRKQGKRKIVRRHIKEEKIREIELSNQFQILAEELNEDKVEEAELDAMAEKWVGAVYKAVGVDTVPVRGTPRSRKPVRISSELRKMIKERNRCEEEGRRRVLTKLVKARVKRERRGRFKQMAEDAIRGGSRKRWQFMKNFRSKWIGKETVQVPEMGKCILQFSD